VAYGSPDAKPKLGRPWPGHPSRERDRNSWTIVASRLRIRDRSRLLFSVLLPRFINSITVAPAKGLSQDNLAYEAEVSRSYLSQLEKGAFYASLKIVEKLARVLDVEPAELLRSPQRRKKPDR
jgi:DNA-binding XRE family transcriptional regulator